MDIQQLLSATQGHTKALASRNGNGDPVGQFAQALNRAASHGGDSAHHSMQPERATDELAAQLQALGQALGLELDEQQLQTLLEQPGTDAGTPFEATGELADMRVALAETASRLALMAQFNESEPSVDALPISQEALDQLTSLADQAPAAQPGAASPAEGEIPDTAMLALLPLMQQLSGQALTTTSASTANPLEASSGNADPRLSSLLETLAAAQRSSVNDGKPAQATAPIEWQATPLLRPGNEAPATSLATILSNQAAVPGSAAGAAGSLAGDTSQLPGTPPLPNPSSAAPVLTTTATLATPVNQQGWSQQLGQQLVQFVQRGGEQQIKMQLHPAELGPLSISLKVSEHGAQAHFVSAHAQVRQVLEQAMPQLREALAEQGISLGETSVGEQSGEQAQSFAEQRKLAQGGGAGSVGDSGIADMENAPRPMTVTDLTLDGRVDLYA